MNDTELMKKLKKVAIMKTVPFCYSCYIDCPNGICRICHSDDLMRKLEDIGVEYGIMWVINHLIEKNVEIFNIENAFQNHITSQYGQKVQIAFLNTDLIEAIKSVDEVAWEMEKKSFLGDLKLVGEVYEIKNNYYLAESVEKFVNAQLEGIFPDNTIENYQINKL